MTDEQFELASAYLDGAVSDDERARVEGDPEMLELVRELRVISTAVSDADPPSATTREAAISAALAEFDATISSGSDPTEVMPATPPAIPPAPSLAGVDESSVGRADAMVVPMAPRRRFRLGHAISVAAAAVVVLAGGVALFRDDAEAPTNDAVERQTVDGLPSEPDAPLVIPTTTAAATAAEPPVAPAELEAEAEADADGDGDAATPDEATVGDAPEQADAPDEAAAGAPAPPSATTGPSGTTFGAVPAPQAGPGAPAPTIAATAAEPLATTSPDDDAGASAADVGPAVEAPTSVGTPATLSEAPVVPAEDDATAVATEPPEPPELTTREEFAEFASALAEPPHVMLSDAAPPASMAEYSPVTTTELPTLDEATTRCGPPVTEPWTPDAVYVTDDGIAHPIAVVLLGEAEPPAYGGVDVVSCELIVDTAEPSLVTTTVAGTTTP